MFGEGRDRALVRAWLEGRSISRGLPAPVFDRGSWRVDTNLDDERVRWVFAAPEEGITAIGREVTKPFHLLKLCGEAEVLLSLLPDRWRLMSSSYFMSADITLSGPVVPLGYDLELSAEGGVNHAAIFARDGKLAASGFAVETEEAFVYDRIRTEPDHRRRGLGRAVMGALASCRKSAASQQVLTATEEGKALYLSMGWTVLSPYVTAGIPPTRNEGEM
ncbi:Acetyltransferase (GNAT) family protein [Novosphingobium sp. CF614]|uniref:GNAT family N-acetyltransferase n=1 Tax=Novosphingobium sp. CF614 TaxID=1884364 RepID=UPI0008E4A588|nr:GNAT family N-acetyltransferase [Novosphingobium sp. CF614]SFG26952.1 Acetyltransferase (GNAT) family protein [Novosphingobium sp. CF614]